DGIAKLSAEWLFQNMPELTNIQFVMYGPRCMSHAIVVAAQAVGAGLTHTCLVLKSWHNFEGRYYQAGANVEDAIDVTSAISRIWGTPSSYGTLVQLPASCRK